MEKSVKMGEFFEESSRMRRTIWKLSNLDQFYSIQTSFGSLITNFKPVFQILLKFNQKSLFMEIFGLKLNFRPT